MATNPLYNTNDSPNGATQPSKAVNDMDVFVNRNRNTFDLSYFNFKTQRFGQYEPFFVMEGVPGDTIPLHSSHQVRSLPMKSPFLSSLTLSKDYFMVPMQAILPNTWEMIFRNPASGDDVPDDANCCFKYLLPKVNFSLWNYDNTTGTVGQFIHQMSVILTLQNLLSSGSLLNQLGFSLLPSRSDLVNLDFDPSALDEFDFDKVCDQFFSELRSVLISNGNHKLIFHFSEGSSSESFSFQATDVSVQQLADIFTYHWNDFVGIGTNATGNFPMSAFRVFENYTFFYNDVLYPFTKDLSINISRVLAYQLCCQQFYVNTKIDPIYNAQIYRDNFFYILKNAYLQDLSIQLSMESFERNGVNVPYDFFSAHYWNDYHLRKGDNNFGIHDYALYEYIFAFRRVLKFGDYFTSSRTQPLGTDATGQMNAPVVGDKVAAIDMSKSIVMQRFLNNVVKLGNDFGEYLRGIFGTEPSPDYHFPKFISHQEFDVSGFEVANSNDVEQGKLVTNLNSGADKYAFEVRVDMPCIILGISNFNCPRVYSDYRNPFFFHQDRFDMFNPMLQYIGDQPVKQNLRIISNLPSDSVFGYQSRNGEYKQSISVASGGFYRLLPSWTFVPDSLDAPIFDYDSKQSSYMLRVYPHEFDRFFASLSGYSLGDAFHFIVVYNNKVMASRPMAVNPSIL